MSFQFSFITIVIIVITIQQMFWIVCNNIQIQHLIPMWNPILIKFTHFVHNEHLKSEKILTQR